MFKSLFLTLIAVVMGVSAQSQVTRWRGPEGNGVYPDKNLLKEWPVEGPTMVSPPRFLPVIAFILREPLKIRDMFMYCHLKGS
jgi:hypothetical protein